MKTIDDAAKEYADKAYPKVGLHEDWVDDGYDEGYKDAKSRLSVGDFIAGVEFTQRWIPIEEELPETNEFYESKICLVKNTYGNVDVARYYSNTKSWYFNSSDFVVTHWRAIEFN